MDELSVKCLLYSDDQVILATSTYELQETGSVPQKDKLNPYRIILLSVRLPVHPSVFQDPLFQEHVDVSS
ncbi:hypothetical protein EVAR_49834_1 [Eumeta japonica]|uniref:Uncharacterized protein n=1 Tax=Eumeta variegata TaxID=151549 RepID=A0A4C1Z1F1_EUMVA|nr:hypothetical protein EVAR_49834_1 [Eumeta japonica]